MRKRKFSLWQAITTKDIKSGALDPQGSDSGRVRKTSGDRLRRLTYENLRDFTSTRLRKMTSSFLSPWRTDWTTKPEEIDLINAPHQKRSATRWISGTIAPKDRNAFLRYHNALESSFWVKILASIIIVGCISIVIVLLIESL